MARDTRRGGGLAWDGIGPDGSVIESFPGAALLIDGSLDEMKAEPSRRDFLTVSARSLLVTTGVILSTTQPSASVETTPVAPLPIQEGVLIDMLPKNLSYAERFRMAREAGFEVVQAQTTSDSMVAEEIKRASEEAGLPIDSVENMHQWPYALSSAAPAIVEKGLEEMRLC